MAEPRLRRPDGGPLPPGWRGLRWLASRAKRRDGLVQRHMWQWLPERLPPVVAGYPDGRRFLAPRGDAMYAQVFLYGAYEPDATRVLASLLRPGDLAVDVGANHGWYSVLMGARVGPGGRVLAVEPVPPLLDALRRNVELNPELPVEVLPIALGKEEGELEMHLFRGLPHGHASASTLGREDYESYTVPSRPLDAVLAEAGGPAPALVKVDVEGAELDVLRGAAALAAGDGAPIWILEVNYETSEAFGYEPVQMLRELESLGAYRTFRIESAGLEPERDPGSAAHGALWVCVPPGREDRLPA